MARFTPTDVESSYAAISALNANFDDIATLLEKCVFRDGTSPNQMEADLNMNGFRLLNVGSETSTPTSPQRLSFGPKVAVRTLRKAIDLSDTIHTQIVGYAAGTTGGLGLTKYLVDNESQDPSVPNSWPYALAKVNASGGCIVFDPRGHFNIIMEGDNRITANNVTVIAPGRNVTFWAASLSGSFSITGDNIIVGYCEFRTMPGVLAIYDDVTGLKTEQKLVAIDPHLSDQVAMIGCEYRHSSDGACDITTPLLVAASPQSRVTIQDFIFWDTDQPMMVGSGDPLCATTDPALLKLTLHNGIFAYCGERQPKVLGRTTVDMSNVYTLTLPFQRDQLAPTNEFGACYGADAMTGGTLQARGCLWTAIDGVGGYPALQVATDTNGVDGAANATDCAAENGMTIVPGNITRIPALTYTLAHDPVPAAGTAREAWIAERWSTCGARVDSAPEGIFVWTSATTAYPNGETILVDRALGGRWIRIDTQAEFAKEFSKQTIALSSGSFVPTLTAVANCSALTVLRADYQQVGKRITASVVVSGTLTTTATSTSFGISLPLARDFTSISDLSGSCRTVTATNQVGGYVNADAVNDRAQATITPTIASGGTFTISVDFRYMLS